LFRIQVSARIQHQVSRACFCLLAVHQPDRRPVGGRAGRQHFHFRAGGQDEVVGPGRGGPVGVLADASWSMAPVLSGSVNAGTTMSRA
jgi:hypothetical protein